MLSTTQILASVLRFGFAGLQTRAGSRMTAASLPLLFGAGLSCIAAAFAIAALSDYMVEILGATRGHLAVACVLLCLGLVAFLVGNRLRASRQRALGAAAPRIHPELASLVNGAEELVRENKSTSLLAAFLAGLYVDHERHSASGR